MSDLGNLPFRAVEEFCPLITAEQGFPAMERLAFEAQRHLWLSFRIFDPATRLRFATNIGSTWLDLLRNRLAAGVRIRVLLTDFDPIVAHDLHEASARSAALLGEISGNGDLQTMVVRHDARVGKGLRFGLWLPAARELELQRRELNSLPLDDRADIFSHRPGIWRYLWQREDGKIAWRAFKLPRLFPATFHQKIVVADHQSAIIGGLDIDERRYDSPAHDREASETWHDVAVNLTGGVVSDISHHIASCWNENRLRMQVLHREQSRHAPSDGITLPTQISPLETDEIPDARAASQGIRLLRTKSVQKRRVGLQLSPATVENEIEQAHMAAISSAQKAIYIETQFFRSQAIADALVQVARQNPTVNLVLILPAAPEEIAFEEKLGLPERMGEYLQTECLSAINDAFGARAVILSPVRNVPSNSTSRDQLHGAEIIYVHSKVLIIDGTKFIVGSANLNGRSMRWDTEAAVECTDVTQIQKLRQAVLKHWLPDNPDPSYFNVSEMAKHWGALADSNAHRPPDQREGFLVPHDPSPAKQVGARLPGVPDELV